MAEVKLQIQDSSNLSTAQIAAPNISACNLSDGKLAIFGDIEAKVQPWVRKRHAARCNASSVANGSGMMSLLY
jgi:hypothetical protein